MWMMLSCVQHFCLFMYLGLPLGGYPKSSSFWQAVIDKIQKKLDRWKRFNLSRGGGRLTLCNSVLSSILFITRKFSQCLSKLLWKWEEF